MSRPRRRGRTAPTVDVLYVVVVPARNEHLVLADTLADLTALQPGSQCRVLVVDDGSTDSTGAIADAWAARDRRIRVLHRRKPYAATGKSGALNAAYLGITSACRTGDPWLAGYPPERVVMVIVDADGHLDPHCLTTVAGYFGDPHVGSVQIGVRIANASRSALARMQDMEFVGFSWLVQVARDRLGSSGLGGNGQFTRLAALDSLGDRPWTPAALTEDLDLGLRLVLAGWRTRFCHEAEVSQQGLETWRPLLRQRTRWIQGHYQCWRYAPALARARRVRWAARADLIAYLLLVVTVLLVSATMAISGLAYAGVLDASNSFLAFVPAGAARRAASLACSIVPVTVFLWTYQRHSHRPFRWFEVPAYALAFTLYTYVWLFTTLRALARIATGRRSWVKTPRVAAVAEPVLQ
jgi:cellulose synthase/poly-beta-1,6-N-acetylglucosamine synthase-like glycosyltransferase